MLETLTAYRTTIMDTNIKSSMNVKIRNVSGACIEASDKPNCMNVNIKGVSAENLLNHVDILTAIDYYGVTEFLDTIGEDKIRSYLTLGK
jgi:hypothetical protein